MTLITAIDVTDLDLKLSSQFKKTFADISFILMVGIDKASEEFSKSFSIVKCLFSVVRLVPLLSNVFAIVMLVVLNDSVRFDTEKKLFSHVLCLFATLYFRQVD